MNKKYKSQKQKDKHKEKYLQAQVAILSHSFY